MAAPPSIALQLTPTPAAWLEAACEQWQELLIDHGYCEKKAASSALALIFAYPECTEQNLALARLAREELRHYEQVTRMMQVLGVSFRLLARAEARHGELYLTLAGAAALAAGGADYSVRLAELSAIEAQLILEADEQLRFHSDPPRGSTCSS